MERKRFIVDCVSHFCLLAFLIIADQLTKLWAREVLVKAPIIVWKDV